MKRIGRIIYYLDPHRKSAYIYHHDHVDLALFVVLFVTSDYAASLFRDLLLRTHDRGKLSGSPACDFSMGFITINSFR